MIPDLRLLDASSPVFMPRHPHRPDGPGPARYLVRQLAPPTTNDALRYNRAADFLVTVVEGQDPEVTVTARRTGNLEITTKDRSGTVLTGACYEIWTKKTSGGREILVTKACDQQPGQTGSTRDGVVRLEVIPAGDYIILESFGPAGYRTVAEFTITIPGGRTTEIDVVNDRS